MLIEKTIEIIEKLQAIKDNKKLWNVASLFITVIVFFSVFNSYAIYAESIPYENVKYDAMQGWQDETNKSSDLTTAERSIYHTNKDSFQGAGLAFLHTLAMEGDSNYEAVLNDPDVSPMAKKGVFTVVQENVMAAASNPPSVNVIAHLEEQWVPGQQTEQYSTFAMDGYEYMRGLGIDSLWSITRNIAYVLFVVIMIITGFMIMFRQKIGGQVAITVFNSIPNIIIGLLMVTFSFGIVGVILNISAMLTNVVAAILFGSDLTEAIFVTNIFSILTGGFEQIAGTVIGSSGIGAIITGVGVALGTVTGTMAATAATGGTILVAGGLLFIAVALVVTLIYIYAGVRVWFTLFKAFLAIIFDTIMGPLVLTFGSLPGQSARQVSWVLKIVKNALVFPIVFFFVNLPSYLNANNVFFDPTGVIRGDFSGAQSGMLEVIMILIVPLAMYFFAADAPKMLDDLIPADGSKGVAAALQGTMGALKKIPLVGSFLG